jgi:hypothetical protein
MTLPAGTSLGPYQILAAIGAGGMGEVYRARDPRLGRAVAVYPASFFTGVDPVPHGVLDQRHERRRRTANLQRRGVDVHRVLQAIGHAHLHQLEIWPNEVKLALDGRGRLVERRHRRAQVRDQAPEHGRRMRRPRVDERLHVRERIEEEVWSDLRLQEMQTRVERLALELTPLECERELLIASEGFLLTDDRRERGPRREEDAGEREMRPPGHPRRILPERRRTAGSGQDVDQQRRDRHEDADRDDLKCPSLEPARKPPGPRFEQREGSRHRQAEDDRPEEE